jgi:hypothetical protein
MAAFPQQPPNVPVHREQVIERTLTQRISDPQQPAPVRQVNVAQLRQDAEELARLGQTVQAQIKEAERGAVPKDLGENLKTIQKLSKRLRAELLL